MRLICFALLLLLLLMPNSSGQTEGNQITQISLSNEALLKIVVATCGKANDFYKVEKFPVLEPNPIFDDIRSHTDPFYKEIAISFQQKEEASFGIEILSSTGNISRFNNWKAIHADADAPTFITPPPARWSKTHATEVATRFADIFIKPWGVHLAEPFAFFTWVNSGYDQKTHKITTGTGEWVVKWRRATASGVPFATDGMEMDISEEYGPDSIAMFFMTKYDDNQPFKPIPETQALIESRKGLDRILGWGPAKAWLPSAKMVGDPVCKLYIVQPNDLSSMKGLADMSQPGIGKGRLAWATLYYLVDPTNPSINSHVGVYIDAKDGSFLGGTL